MRPVGAPHKVRGPSSGDAVHPPVWLWIGLGLVVFVIPAVLLVSAGVQATHPDTDRIDDVRHLTRLIVDRARRTGRWPPFGGERFVLSVVAYGDSRVGRREDARLFFSGYRPAGALPDPAAYAGITPESLETLPGASLTSYAGRRNAEERWRLPDGEAPDAPILADLVPPGGAIVGFASGRTAFLGRRALELGPDDPLVVGEATRSPALRALSGE